MQDDSSSNMSLTDRAEQIRWLMKWPALTVMVITRWDIGYRVLNPVGLAAMFIVTMLVAGFAGSASRPQDLAVFAWVMLGAGVLQRLLRWRDLQKGIQQHTYYIGTSFIQKLARKQWLQSERRASRFIEPPFVLAVGILLNRLSSHALGCWLIFCGVALFIFEDAVFRKELHRKLDMADGLVDAQIQTEYVEQFENSTPRRQSEQSQGIPTGLGKDLHDHISKRKTTTKPK